MENHLYALIIIIPIIIFILEYYKIKSYTIDGQYLTIIRRFRNIIIDTTQVAELQEISSLRELKMIKLYGINFGPLSYKSGIFWSYKYGIIHLFINRKENPILITLRNRKKYLISPDNEEKALIQEFCPVKILNYQ